ncbi:MAG TPA: hypothetical protein VJV78_47745 [Polyangiales bacterium]|nr:hypothetical protein [Polyangiales bacterium]
MRRLIGAAACLVVFVSAACKAETNDGAGATTSDATRAPESQRDTGARVSPATPALDAGTPDASSVSKPMDAAAPPAPTASMDAAVRTEPPAAATDAGTAAAPDATPGPDARIAPSDLGSCCAAHDNAGCSNADLQVCVCEKLPACCTDAWEPACALIVKQKFCQPGVRDCVCGDGPKQWGQHACCDSTWSETFCNQVAEQKCAAVPGCL